MTFVYHTIRCELSKLLVEIERVEKGRALQEEIDYLRDAISFYESLCDTESTAYVERLHKKYEDLMSIKRELTAIKGLIIQLNARWLSHAIHESKAYTKTKR